MTSSYDEISESFIMVGIFERPDLRRRVLFSGFAYFVLAQGAYALVGRGKVMGISPGVLQGLLVALAAITFIVIAVGVARKEGSDWWKPTIFTCVFGAGLGALAHGFAFAIRVRWGATCNQCQPVLYVIWISAMAVILGAIGATIVGFVARRTRPVRDSAPVI